MKFFWSKIAPRKLLSLWNPIEKAVGWVCRPTKNRAENFLNFRHSHCISLHNFAPIFWKLHENRRNFSFQNFRFNTQPTSKAVRIFRRSVKVAEFLRNFANLFLKIPPPPDLGWAWTPKNGGLKIVFFHVSFCASAHFLATFQGRLGVSPNMVEN